MMSRQRNVPIEEWKSHFRKICEDTHGAIPPGEGKISIIERASVLAGYQRPHANIPSARKVLQQMLRDGELRYQNGDGHRKRPVSRVNLPEIRNVKRNAIVNIMPQEEEDEGSGLSNLFSLVRESYHALITIGTRVSKIDAEFVKLRNSAQEIDDMRMSVQKMLQELSEQDDD